MCGSDACATAGGRVADNVAGSPFYYLERVERYQLLGDPLDCILCTSPGSLSRELQQCWEESEESSFTNSVGLEVSVEGGASFLGVSGGYSVTLSTELSWTTTTASSYGECTVDIYTASVEPGQIGAFINVSNEFRARPEEDAPASLPDVVSAFRASAGLVKYLRWPLD